MQFHNNGIVEARLVWYARLHSQRELMDTVVSPGPAWAGLALVQPRWCRRAVRCLQSQSRSESDVYIYSIIAATNVYESKVGQVVQSVRRTQSDTQAPWV
jgi:hypothetical protein